MKPKQSRSEWKTGSIRDWIALTRAEHALIVIIAIAASEFVVSKTFKPEFLLSAIGPALITLGAFAWNDYFGIKTDAILKRTDRPLVSGRISKQAAFYGAIALFALGVLFSSFVNQTAFAIAAIFTILSMLYDPVLKKLPLLGNAFIASSMSISFVYGNYALTPALNYYVLLFALVSFTAGLGRELILTLRDVEGDKKIGAKTLPMQIGARKTSILASALLHLSVAFSLVPLTKTFNVVYAAFVLVTGALLLYSAWKLVLGQSQASLKKIRNYTLYALLTGVLAFAALGL